MDGASSLGTATLSGGSAGFSTSALAVGSHSITVVYGGDGNFNGSTSGPLSQMVNKANTLAIVSSGQNPSVFGQSVMFTGTLSAVAPGAGTPTGMVHFNDNGSQIGSATLSAGSASFSTVNLSAGSHPITVPYAGDGNFNGTTSVAISQTVNKAATSTVLGSSANPSTNGQSVTFTATVSVNAPGAGTPQGTVNFNDGATFLGSGSLSGGIATFSTAALTVGTHAITASYAGDVNFAVSTSNAVQQQVDPTGGPNADLGVAVTHPFTHPAGFGSAFTETIRVTNHGPDATGATLVITVSGNFLAGQVTGTGCIVGGTINCNLGTLNSGDTSVVTIPITPLLGRTISIHAAVSGTLLDNVPADDDAVEVIQVRHRPLAK
jgi:hypothetical protein